MDTNSDTIGYSIRREVPQIRMSLKSPTPYEDADTRILRPQSSRVLPRTPPPPPRGGRPPRDPRPASPDQPGRGPLLIRRSDRADGDAAREDRRDASSDLTSPRSPLSLAHT